MSSKAKQFPNEVIRASAGTGKTFQLSNRFLALATSGASLDTILATTFTRKAAGEILDRVLVRLATAALDPAKLTELAAHIGQPRFDRPRCLALLTSMVHQLHRLRVSTLDSFFVEIAQSYSLELGLPPGWRIVEVIDDMWLRAEAVRQVLEQGSTDETLRLMHLLTKGEATRSVAEQLNDLVNNLYDYYREAPAEAWRKLPRPKLMSPPQLDRAVAEVAEVPLHEEKRCATARDRDIEAFESENWERFLSNGLGGAIFAKGALYFKKPIPSEVVALYEPLVDHARTVLIGRIANQNEATHRLLERFDAVYQRLRTTRRALRFDDVTRLLGGAVVDRRMEEIAYRLDAQVTHLLLDEFQDTSAPQWRVLRPFAQRAVDRRQQSFFCVGDVKQAIYGWRGGVAEIFETLQDDLGSLDYRPLNQSWRSSQPVIDTVNRVFEDLRGNPALADHAEAAAKWAARFTPHTTARGELPGHCRLIAAPRAEEGADQGTMNLTYAARQIVELHHQAPHLSIGVLVRRNAAVARVIYELRRHHGIEASEEGGNPLTDSAAVQVVLSVLKLADHPGDTVARFHLAHAPLAEVLGMARWDDSAAAVRLAAEVRRRLIGDGYGPTIRGWVERLAVACDRRDLSRLGQLVEMAYTYDHVATTRPRDFLELVAQQKVEDPTAAPIRVMTLHQAKGLQFDMVVLPEIDSRLAGQPSQMAIGRDKPTGEVTQVCRYVPKDLRPLLPASFQRMFSVQQQQDVEESLCVLYVGMTRAVHALHMIVAPSKENEKNLGATGAGLLRGALTEGHKAEPETVLFEHGDPSWVEKLPATPVGPAVEPEIAQPSLVRLAPPPAQSLRRLDRVSPSQLEGGVRVDLAESMRGTASVARERGTLMHAWFELVEWLDDGPPDDAQLLSTAGSLDTSRLDLSALIEQFHRALRRPVVQEVLSRSTYQQQAASTSGTSPVHLRDELADPQWRVWRERPFAVREGSAIVHGTIDRLVVLYDGSQPVGAEVIDFKTDAVDPNDRAAMEKKVDFYRPQLEAYRRAVATMFALPESKVLARLLFVGPGVVEEV